MSKRLVEKSFLERTALIEIRARAGGEKVSAVFVEPVADPALQSNWRIAGVAPGASVQTIDFVQHSLRERFDLRLEDRLGRARP